MRSSSISQPCCPLWCCPPFKVAVTHNRQELSRCLGSGASQALCSSTPAHLHLGHSRVLRAAPRCPGLGWAGLGVLPELALHPPELAEFCCRLHLIHGIPASASPPEGFHTSLARVKEVSLSNRGRYSEKQDTDASVEPLYWLVHVLAAVAPFLLLVLRIDFYCLILCK